MSYTLPPDLQQLIESRVAVVGYASAEEVVRDALRALADEDEDLQALRQAVDAWRAGDSGTPLADAFQKVRAERAPSNKC